LSEAALWLNYCLSAGIAFAAIYRGRWRVVPAMLLGTAVTLAIWLIVSLASGGTFDDPWLEPALIINGCFSLLFAGAGAAFGYSATTFRKP